MARLQVGKNGGGKKRTGSGWMLITEREGGEGGGGWEGKERRGVKGRASIERI